MNIAICDDEITFLNKLQKQILTILKYEQCHIDQYSSGNNLLELFSPNKYDIIILDIEMNGLTGIETAKKIRDVDRDVTIAFLTSYEDFAIEGYSVKAERYILKNQPVNMYREQLTSLFNEYNQKHQRFNYNSGSKVFSEKLSDITYFEVFNRIIIVHTFDETFKFYGKISELESEYKEKGFMKIGKSYLVNVVNIKFISANEVHMKDGNTIFIGRSIKNQVVEEYMNYLSGR